MTETYFFYFLRVNIREKFPWEMEVSVISDNGDNNFVEPCWQPCDHTWRPLPQDLLRDRLKLASELRQIRSQGRQVTTFDLWLYWIWFPSHCSGDQTRKRKNRDTCQYWMTFNKYLFILIEYYICWTYFLPNLYVFGNWLNPSRSLPDLYLSRNLLFLSADAHPCRNTHGSIVLENGATKIYTYLYKD